MTSDSTRRELMAAGAAGLAAMAAATQSAAQDANTGDRGVSDEQVRGAERLAGVTYTDAERAQMLPGLADQLEAIRMLRAIEKPNDLAPAQTFDPRLPGVSYASQTSGPWSAPPMDYMPPGLRGADEDIAFSPVSVLQHWLRTGALRSRRLTEIYLARIERHDPTLQCFIHVTRERALREADEADREIGAGRHRGPLHGIPYGLKDLFDAEGAPTTWGAEPYANRPPATRDSAVARKLKEAGAVLLGKTATGALAYGDIWHGGRCKNPWNTDEGSSGSSAGSACATAAGLIAFGIGTETLGSIVSPSHRCGTTGLRPTFGRVSRAGGMALCWSLDKVGAICRSVMDTALVLSAINGGDPADASSIDHGLAWDAAEARGMRVGYDPRWMESAEAHDVAAMEAARMAGATLLEIRIPEIPAQLLGMGVFIEAAAAFEELTLKNWDDLLDWQDAIAWPNVMRRARFISAIDYIQIDRLRRRAMLEMHEAFAGLDCMIGPNFAGGMLTITNFTGHPQLALRAGFADSQARTMQGRPIEGTPARRTPRATSLWAPLFEERKLVRLGSAIEARLDVARERPPLS